MKYTKAYQLIGNTPLIQLQNIEENYHLNNHLFAKVEFFNPAGSVKDRAALQMINEKEKEGLINKETVIIEPTSGNTGIAIASICAMKGYRAILVMPESMSIERRKLLKAYGAEIVLSPAKEGMKGAIRIANELKEQYGNALILGQFDNMDNVKAHYLTTGPEIYKDLDGKVDIFVAGIGTGGTITGVGKYLKERLPNVYIVGVEPSDSPFLSENRSGPHAIQGIGAGFAPSILDKEIYDEIITITKEEAFEAARMVGKKEGMLVGISSGAVLYAAIKISEKCQDKNIVALLPDSGDRYLSTELFEYSEN